MEDVENWKLEIGNWGKPFIGSEVHGSKVQNL